MTSLGSRSRSSATAAGSTAPSSFSTPGNASAAGQSITLPEPAAALSFVGSAVNGNQQAKATVTCTDGSRGEAALAFTDWTVGGGGAVVQYGNRVIAEAAYRKVAGADEDPVATYVFATQPVEAPAGKRIASVRLRATPTRTSSLAVK